MNKTSFFVYYVINALMFSVGSEQRRLGTIVKSFYFDFFTQKTLELFKAWSTRTLVLLKMPFSPLIQFKIKPVHTFSMSSPRQSNRW